jgi:hypothetical protein
MVDLWIEISALAVLIGLSGFFSGLEVALVGVRKSKVVQLFNEGKKGSKTLHKLKTNPSWMMSSVNLGNNLVNVGASALATSVAIRLFGNDGLGIAVGVMTFLILVFGEITPKTYCNANSTKIALRYAPVLLAFSYVFYPIVKFFEVITKGVVKMTGSSYTPPPITEEDIKGVIDQGLEEKALDQTQSYLNASNTGAYLNAILVEFALQYVFGVISPNTRIKNVITPTAIPNPSLPNNLIATLVASADAPTFTRLFPKFTLDIIQLGFVFSLCSVLEPFLPSLNN